MYGKSRITQDATSLIFGLNQQKKKLGIVLQCLVVRCPVTHGDPELGQEWPRSQRHRDLRTGFSKVCGPGYPTASTEAQHQLSDLISSSASKSTLREPYISS